MPEIPDLTVYLDFLQTHIVGEMLEHVRLASPFVLRTADPPLKSAEGKRVLGLRRLGKRLIFELEDDLFLTIHLMIAGRFRWKEKGAAITGKIGLAAFDRSLQVAHLRLQPASGRCDGRARAVEGGVRDQLGRELHAELGERVEHAVVAQPARDLPDRAAELEDRDFEGAGLIRHPVPNASMIWP